MEQAPDPVETTSADAESHTKPLATFRHHSISASVFENQGPKGGTYYNVSVRNRYKDNEGQWQTSTNFLRDELPVLRELVRQAYAFILEQEK